MNIVCQPDGDNYIINAESIHGKKSYVSEPGDGINEYVKQKGRLNTSYIVAMLTEAQEPTPAQRDFLEFVNKANDGFRQRRQRPEGWEKSLSDGVNRKGQSVKPGDVHVMGHTAYGIIKANTGNPENVTE